MSRVLLVDDDATVLNGLRSTIDWAGNGFVVVGAASNGHKAMKWIKEYEVDILITDIVMPVMDGLELTKQTREHSPHTKILLLSSYNDFEYAREGIRLGASDYLLKPTLENEDLLEVLDKIKGQIKEEKEQHNLAHRLQENKQKEERKEMENSLSILLEGKGRLEATNLLAAKLQHGFWFVACMLDYNKQINKEEEMIEIIMQYVKEMLYQHLDGIVVRGSRQLWIIGLPDSDRHNIELMDSLHKCHRALLDKGVSVTLGISSRFTSLDHILQANTDCRAAVSRRFFYGTGIIYNAIPKPKIDWMRSRAQFQKTTEMFRSSLRESDKEQAKSHLQSMMSEWCETGRLPDDVMHEASVMIRIIYEHQESYIDASEYMDMLKLLETMDEVKKFLWAHFNKRWADVLEQEFGFHKRIVKHGLEYMEANYMNPITLQDVAQHAAISKNYFSEIFKKVTGQNFIEHLIYLRIKKAKELLKTTSLKVYEIAELCGFNDEKYFAKTFRRKMNMSPTDFRNIE